jgi:hypothetical protein
MREMTTRYGREGLGFLWVVGEPLLFCFGVIIMWTLVKPAYEGSQILFAASTEDQNHEEDENRRAQAHKEIELP